MISDLFDRDLVMENDRFVLRPIRSTDAEDIFKIFSDKLVMKYYDLLPFENYGRAVEQTGFFINSRNERKMIRWGIEFKETGKK